MTTPVPVQVTNVYKGKNQQIGGVVLAVVGVVLLIDSCPERSAAGALLGWLSCLAGLVLLLVGKLRHWYHAE